MNKIIKNISLFTSIIALMSCGEANKSSTEVATDAIETNIVSASEAGSKLYNIPSPIETLTILKMSGATFDKALLNPAKNISRYASVFSKSVNLGTYSADLSFCLLYKENQDINFYLKNVNELTTALGINGDFAQSMTKRLKANPNNSDSVMQIVSEASVDAYLYLKENQRNNTSVLITAGGWVEGMHFVTHMAEKSKNKEILGLVASQKKVVKNLIKMLEKFETDPEIAALLVDIKDIAAIYETLKPIQEVATASEDKSMASIGSSKSFEVTDEQLKAIKEKVVVLRNKLTT